MDGLASVYNCNTILEKPTFWKTIMASSKSMVAKKCWSRSTSGTFVHALATSVNDGWNSLWHSGETQVTHVVRVHHTCMTRICGGGRVR